jgi:hypothetical protein
MNEQFPPPWPLENQIYNSEEQYKEWFIGEKYLSYYKKHFNQITTKKTTSGFNIGAFFLGPIWMFYRKMYLYGWIYIICMLIFSIVMELMGISEMLDRGISIGITVALGMFGNTLYKNFVEKKIKHLIQIEQPASLENILKENGGTNMISALIFLMIFTGFILLGFYADV